MADATDGKPAKINVLDEPCRENGFVWIVSVEMDGFLGVGKHRIKRSAVMLADKKAREEKYLSETDCVGSEEKDTPPQPDIPIRCHSEIPKDPRAKKRKLFGIINELAEERGRRAEDSFFNAFNNPDPEAPSWFLGIRRATPEQDWLQQIDAIVMTKDVGDINIQIKSSFGGRRRFLDENPPPDIQCIVITAAHTDERIRFDVYRGAAYQRQVKLEKKNKTL